MLAVRFHGVGDVRVEDIPEIEAGPGEALIKIAYGGICGSDLHIYREGMFVEKIPEIMGHEFIGHIVTVPEGCGLSPGDVVVGDPRVPCGKCNSCRDGYYNRCLSLGFIGEVSPGGFAQYLAIEPEKLIRLDDHVDLKQGALLEPLAVAVHACRNMHPQAKDKVLIVGGGPVGLLIAYLLKKQYQVAYVAVSDIDAYRLFMAQKAGVDKTALDVTSLAGECSLIVDAAGSESAFAAILEKARHGSTIYISAIYERIPRLDLNWVVGKELTIKGNNNYNTDSLEEAARLIESGTYDFSWLISRILHARDAREGFQLLTAKEKKDMKILLEFS